MPLVDVEEHDGVTVVTLRRPPANALDPALVTDLVDVLERLASEGPPAVVLTGAGTFFCGGADLRVVPELPVDVLAGMARGVNRLFAGWHRFPGPMVAAVNGHAVAGGLVLALCGDYRVGPTTGRFGLTEVKVGIPFPSAAMAVVRAELTPAAARRLVLRGDLFDSATAAGLGVFDEVVADDDVVPRALAVARELAALPPHTYEAVKRRLRDPDAWGRGSMGGTDEIDARVIDEARTAAPAVLDEPR